MKKILLILILFMIFNFGSNIKFLKKSFALEVNIILQIGENYYWVNGIKKFLDSPPIIKNKRTLLPIRPIIEAIDGYLTWDEFYQKVTIFVNKIVIELWIGKNIAKVNGKDKYIDSNNPNVVPEIINKRTMLPLRFIVENIGAEIEWEELTKKIYIKYNLTESKDIELFTKSVTYENKNYDSTIIKINPKKYNIVPLFSPDSLETSYNHIDYVKLYNPIALINGIPFDTTTLKLSGSIESNYFINYISIGYKETIGINHNYKPFYYEGRVEIALTTDKGKTIKTYSVNNESWGEFMIYTNFYKKPVEYKRPNILIRINKSGQILAKYYNDYNIKEFYPSNLTNDEFYIYNGVEKNKNTKIDEILIEAKKLYINNNKILNNLYCFKLLIQSTPVLTKEGQVFRGKQVNPDNFRMKKYGPRSLFSFYIEGNFYFIVCENSVSFFDDNIGEALEKINLFWYVVSLDDGSSINFYYKGKFLFEPNRNLVCVSGVFHK